MQSKGAISMKNEWRPAKNAQEKRRETTKILKVVREVA
jgi:hypothetical protein